MKITIVSNYINHHQLPFCRAISSVEDVSFSFVQVMPMEEKRKSMGWAVDESTIPWLVKWYEDKEKAEKLIEESDAVIFGWTENLMEDVKRKRFLSGKLTFYMTERIYREGQWKSISPRGRKAKKKEHGGLENLPVYLLCVGAYVASDFEIIGAYKNKRLKWGYFPGTGQFSGAKPGNGKKIRLCWAGRLITLKHPEYVIRLAQTLKERGYDFSVDLVGGGRLLDDLRGRIKEKGLEDKITLTGGKDPSEVLEYMRKADVFLFTSNYLEGWGAVVNEAMESGCCVVASREAGAVPFLIEDEVSGLVYNNGDYRDFEKKVISLFEDRSRIGRLAAAGQMRIRNTWNAGHAAAELTRFCREFLEGKTPGEALEGPMSRADIIKAPGFLRTLREDNHLE